MQTGDRVNFLFFGAEADGVLRVLCLRVVVWMACIDRGWDVLAEVSRCLS
jgi:hypothetical protein